MQTSPFDQLKSHVKQQDVGYFHSTAEDIKVWKGEIVVSSEPEWGGDNNAESFGDNERWAQLEQRIYEEKSINQNGDNLFLPNKKSSHVF